MSNQLQLALFGAVPALLAMAYFDRLDAKRPEPRSTLRRVALAGALAAIPVILVGQLLTLIGPAGQHGAEQGTSYFGAFYSAFVIAAIPEEAAKMAAVLLFAWRRPEFDERMDGIVYGARAGLGFALIENVAYLLLMPASFAEYLSIFIGRAVLAVPGHATWGAIIGFFAARRRFDGRGPGLWGGYLLAVALHGLYDVFLFAAPVAMAQGHTWVGLGIAGIPIVAYAVPALIIFGGALTVRRLAARAVAADDRDERASAPILVPGGPAAPMAPPGGFGYPPGYPPSTYPYPPPGHAHGPHPHAVQPPPPEVAVGHPRAPDFAPAPHHHPNVPAPPVRGRTGTVVAPGSAAPIPPGSSTATVVASGPPAPAPSGGTLVATPPEPAPRSGGTVLADPEQGR